MQSETDEAGQTVFSESVPSAHLLGGRQGTQHSKSGSPQKQHPLQHIPHAQAGFYLSSCLYLLWSLPTFNSTSPSGEAGRDSMEESPARCPPCFLQSQAAALQVLKCQDEDHSFGNQQHMIMLNCSPVYTCSTKNTTLYHANQSSIYSGCEKAAYLTWMEMVTHLPPSQRCDALAWDLMLCADSMPADRLPFPLRKEARRIKNT